MAYCKSIKEFYETLQKTGPILGIDYGTKKMGLSISDINRVISLPLKTIVAKDVGKAIDEIKSIVESTKAVAFVIGYPLQSNGEPGDMCKLVEKFTKLLLAAVDLPCLYQDERFSSKIHKNFLKHFDIKKKKGYDDQFAACSILEIVLNLLQLKRF
jgi:putative pre-16S rRNA nuclease